MTFLLQRTVGGFDRLMFWHCRHRASCRVWRAIESCCLRNKPVERLHRLSYSRCWGHPACLLLSELLPYAEYRRHCAMRRLSGSWRNFLKLSLTALPAATAAVKRTENLPDFPKAPSSTPVMPPGVLTCMPAKWPMSVSFLNMPRHTAVHPSLLTRSTTPSRCFTLKTRRRASCWGLLASRGATRRPLNARRHIAALASVSSFEPTTRESTGAVTGWLKRSSAHWGP
mmetsp:Transcript_15713/g.47353  ORF Transcript_15713/g.47353 Transcript_15713/m.47353 type:complete len:227 (-) Transcript_15713:670-1350(-)